MKSTYLHYFNLFSQKKSSESEIPQFAHCAVVVLFFCTTFHQSCWQQYFALMISDTARNLKFCNLKKIAEFANESGWQINTDLSNPIQNLENIRLLTKIRNFGPIQLILSGIDLPMDRSIPGSMSKIEQKLWIFH